MDVLAIITKGKWKRINLTWKYVYLQYLIPSFMLFTQSTFYLEMLNVSETVWCNETHSSIAQL